MAETEEKRDGMMTTIVARRKMRATKGTKRREEVEKASGKVGREDARLLGGEFWAARTGLGESWHEVNDIRCYFWTWSLREVFDQRFSHGILSSAFMPIDYGGRSGEEEEELDEAEKMTM